MGGEPMLRDELPGWIAQAKNLGAKLILVQTNGRRLAYKDFALKLRDAGLDALEISLHGSSAAMHDYHTRAPGSWLQTISGLKNVRESNIAVGVTVVVTRSNFRHLSDIARLAASLGASAIRFQGALCLGTAARWRDRVVPAEELALPYLTDAERTARRLGLAVADCEGQTRDFGRFSFAGLGQTQPASIPEDTAQNPLRPPTKAKPGLGEIHRREKKTGEELRPLFPALFKDASGKTA